MSVKLLLLPTKLSVMPSLNRLARSKRPVVLSGRPSLSKNDLNVTSVLRKSELRRRLPDWSVRNNLRSTSWREKSKSRNGKLSKKLPVLNMRRRLRWIASRENRELSRSDLSRRLLALSTRRNSKSKEWKEKKDSRS